MGNFNIFVKRKLKIIFLSLFLVFIGTSCVETRYIEVPVETVKDNYITKIQKDTLIVRDSVDRWLKNDTVFIEKYKYLYKTIHKIDTFYKVDTVANIIYKDKIITVNELKDWQKVFLYIGIFSTVLIVIMIVKKFK